MIILTEKEQEARKRFCLALDNIDSVAEALDLAHQLAPYAGSVKVGKELNQLAVNEGVPIIREIHTRGTGVFLDLKLHDTPNTVYKAAINCTVSGVRMFNIHIAGGEAMCKKAIEGSYEAAEKLSIIPRARIIGVTVLTSLNDSDLQAQGLNIKYDDLVMRRTELAERWGLDGIVCPANKAGKLEKIFGSRLLYVTPGIEWGGKMGEGQKQLYTPDLAVRDTKNSILVIGSAVTKAEDRKKTAYDILRAMASNL